MALALITKDWLAEHHACAKGLAYWESAGAPPDFQTALALCVRDGKRDYARWLTANLPPDVAHPILMEHYEAIEATRDISKALSLVKEKQQDYVLACSYPDLSNGKPGIYSSLYCALIGQYRNALYELYS